MKPQTKLTIVIALIVTIVIFIHQLNIKSKSNSTPQLPIIVTSFYPIHFFTSQIAGNYFQVVNISHPGVEPHDYEPSTGDLITMQKSQALFINGQGFEPWTDRIKDQLASKKVKVISLADGIANREMIDEEGHQSIDPHIWLDPVLATKEVEIIANVLMEVDPGNTQYYQASSQQLKKRLSQLDEQYRTGLANCRQKSVITSHAAFGYLADRYGFEQKTILGLAPQEDPSPKKIAEITDYAKTNNIQYIFFETLVSPSLADTIAKEVGAQTLVFNPLEGLTETEQAKGEDYFSVQLQNLQNLKIALNCQP